MQYKCNPIVIVLLILLILLSSFFTSSCGNRSSSNTASGTESARDKPIVADKPGQEQKQVIDLNDYVGMYKFSDGFVLKVIRDGEKLIADAAEYGKFEMVLVAKEEYALKGDTGILTFIRDKNRRIAGVSTVIEGKTETGTKVQ